MAYPLLPNDPRELGGYYLDGRLGAGGQGVVYEGYAADGSRVAIKALHSVEEADRARLRTEIRAWRLVEPFCTTKVLHADLDGPVPFVVSEFVDGPDLRRAVRESTPKGPEALRRLAVSMAAALVAMHRAGVVHRDLKPENILLGPDGARVIDFGIAKITEGTASAGMPMGTLRYMPPERYRGQPGDSKVDVWGWGAVILFAATGSDAFDGGNWAEVAYNVATRAPDISAVQEPLRSLVTAALAKDPASRPSSEQLLLALLGRADLADALKEGSSGTLSENIELSRAETAEAVFNRLDPRAQELVPGVLLRLVAPGERAEAILRSSRRSQFCDDQVPERARELVLQALTAAGVVVWAGDSAVLASAALVRAWPRLRAWVQAEGAGLGIHQYLAESALLWEQNGGRSHDLVQGTALERAQDWAATGRRHLTLNRLERAFLDGSAKLSRRRGRRRAQLSAVMSVLLVIALASAGVAFGQWRTVIGQRDQATSAQVAGTAMSLRTSNPQLSRRLAVASASLADTPQSRSAITAVRYQKEADSFAPLTFAATTVALDGTGTVLVAASGTRVEVWNVQSRTRTGSYTAPADVHQVDLSQDGRIAALATDDGDVRLLDTSTVRPATPRVFQAGKQQNGYWPTMAVSPKGTYLQIAIGYASQSVLTVWNTSTGKSVATVRASGSAFLVDDTSFTPDESLMSLPHGSGGPYTWIDLSTGSRQPLPDLEAKPVGMVGPVVFSSDGKTAAIETANEIKVFDRTKGDTGTEVKGNESLALDPLAFSHNGRYLAQDGYIWDLTSLSGNPVMTYSTTQSECYANTAFRFTADDRQLRCVGTDGVVRSLDVSAFTHPPAVQGEKYYNEGITSQDRSTVALVHDNDIDIWSAQTHTKQYSVTAGPDGYADVDSLQLSRDGSFLAVDLGTRIQVYEPAQRGDPLMATVPVLPQAQLSGTLVSYAFSPDGKSLAVETDATDGDNTLTLWNLSPLRMLNTQHADLGYTGEDSAVLFQPDGRSLTAAPYFGTVAFPSGAPMTKGSQSLEVDAISDDGATLYAYPDGHKPYIRFWSTRSLQPAGEELRTGTADLPFDAQGPQEATAASSDGRLFATVQQSGPVAFPDFQINIWDSSTRGQVGVALTGAGASQILTLAFTPDGSALTAVDSDGAFFTYPLATAPLVSALCREAGPLTPQEWKAYIPDIPYRRTC